MPINMLDNSHLHYKYLKGLYCISLKLEYETGKFKYVYKIGCSHSDYFYRRLNAYHNSYPYGFLIISFLFMKNSKQKILEAEKYVHSLLKQRVKTTVRQRKPGEEGTSEWFTDDWKSIKEAFLKAQNKYTGWVLFEPAHAGRNKKNMNAYVPTERELEKIQTAKIKQDVFNYDNNFNII